MNSSGNNLGISADGLAAQTPRVLAFYLPQYHPIPENDAWWGPGFTEWTNVARARPRFEGHYQPHIPADLGFYDLRLPETRAAQAALARAYGIYGFCYYHYWFGGRQLLERPLTEVVASGQPDFPFCICWANENWTRRWDGQDSEILIEQTYSVEDDLAHFHYLLPILCDRRYVRVHNRPLLLVYRVDRLPDAGATAQRWRRAAEQSGLPGLYLCAVASSEMDDTHPAHYGFDAVVEFQPDWRDLPPALPPPRLSWRGRLLRRLSGKRQIDPFRVNGVRDYPELVARMLARQEPDYPCFPCVTPGWDNSARRKQNAYIFRDSTPAEYRKWLTHALARSRRNFQDEEQLVFVNAWNEWAEGNHLEPDLRWGRAYLEATRDAVGHCAQRMLDESETNE